MKEFETQTWPSQPSTTTTAMDFVPRVASEALQPDVVIMVLADDRKRHGGLVGE